MANGDTLTEPIRVSSSQDLSGTRSIQDLVRDRLGEQTGRIEESQTKQRGLLENLQLEPTSVGQALGQLLAVGLPVALAGSSRRRGRAAAPAAGALDAATTRREQQLELKRKAAEIEIEVEQDLVDDAQARIGDLEVLQIKDIAATNEREFRAAEAELDREHNLIRDARNNAFRLELRKLDNEAGINKARQGNEEWNRRQERRLELDKELRKFEASLKEAKGKKQLPATQVAEIADTESAVKILENVKEQHRLIRTGIVGDVGRDVADAAHSLGFDRVGPFLRGVGETAGTITSTRASRFTSRMIGALPFIDTDEERYERTRRKAAQLIGRSLEGGKLSDADYESKYIDFLPSSSAPEETANKDFADLEAFAVAVKEGRLQSFDRSGFDVSGFDQSQRSNGGVVTVEPIGNISPKVRRKADQLKEQMRQERGGQ